MFMKICKTTTLALFVAATLLLPFVANAQSADRDRQSEKQPASIQRSDSKFHRKWESEIRPKIEASRKERIKSLTNHANQIRDLVWEARKKVDVEKLTEKLMGLEALFQTVNQRYKVESYIENLLTKAIDTDKLTRQIKQVYSSFERDCARINNELIVACDLDIEFDPRQVKACEVDTSMIHPNLVKMRSELTGELYTTAQQQLVATGVGTITGELIGGPLARELGKSLNGGEANWLTDVMGIAGTWAAEDIASAATMEVLGARTRLSQAIGNAADKLLYSLIGKGGEPGGAELGLLQVYKNHDTMAIKTIFRHVFAEQVKPQQKSRTKNR